MSKRVAAKRMPTKYEGVYYREVRRVGATGMEKSFVITYWYDGRFMEEQVGRQSRDNMTAAKANAHRGAILAGKTLPKVVQKKIAAEQASKKQWTFLALWKEYKEINTGIKGLVTDENRFVKHLQTPFGARRPSDLMPTDVDRLRLDLTRAGLAPATVRNVLELLRRIANFGKKKKLCEGLEFRIGNSRANPDVIMPDLNNEVVELMTDDQLARLLSAIEASDDVMAGNMMLLVLHTGMRRGECFRLRWDDVDLDSGWLRLRDPKGGKDQVIPLNEAAKVVLRAHPKHSTSAYVFYRDDGRQWSPRDSGRDEKGIMARVRRIRDAAKLPANFRPLYSLRHHFASTIASSGKVEMYTLQRLMTHKSPQMTQRYAHLRDDALRSASNLFGDLVAASTTAAGQRGENGGE